MSPIYEAPATKQPRISEGGSETREDGDTAHFSKSTATSEAHVVLTNDSDECLKLMAVQKQLYDVEKTLKSMSQRLGGSIKLFFSILSIFLIYNLSIVCFHLPNQ